MWDFSISGTLGIMVKTMPFILLRLIIYIAITIAYLALTGLGAGIGYGRGNVFAAGEDAAGFVFSGAGIGLALDLSRNLSSWELHRLPRRETLNVRRGPGTSYQAIAELPEHAQDVLVIGNGCTPNPDTEAFTRASRNEQSRMVSKSWCHISWRSPRGKDIEGWVYGKYLQPQLR